jgi:S-adenosylmethionine-diacylglycerol 3-amino-3-carboxypropyl transferase
LQESRFEQVRAGSGAITPVHANLRLFLESLPARHVDAVILLDSQDWMASQEISALWNAIDRVGKESVRVIFRTAGSAAPLEHTELRPVSKIWRRDSERSATGFERDRSGIYGGFHCCARR